MKQPIGAFLSNDRKKEILKERILMLDDEGYQNLLNLEFVTDRLDSAILSLEEEKSLRHERNQLLLKIGDIMSTINWHVDRLENFDRQPASKEPIETPNL
jgi:hypothetical protein